MKAILEFNLPEEQEEFNSAVNGNKYRIVVDQTLSIIRRKLKYEPLSEEVYKAIEELREEIIQEIGDLEI